LRKNRRYSCHNYRNKHRRNPYKDSTKTTENASLTTTLKEEQHEGIKVNSLDFKNPLTDCGTKLQKTEKAIFGFLF
jgi:hypothetical protein